MAENEAGRIFVGGISWKADEESLANFFSTFGKIIECRIIMDKNTKKSKGYGFITFEDPEAAEKVKSSTDLFFLGKMMNVGDAVRKEATTATGAPARAREYGDAAATGYYNARGAEYFQQGQYYPQASQYYNYQGTYPSHYGSFQQGDQTSWQGLQGITGVSNTASGVPSHLPGQTTQGSGPQSNASSSGQNMSTQQQQVYQNYATLQQLQHLHQLQQQQQILHYQQRLFIQQNPQFQQLYQQQLAQQQQQLFQQLQQGGYVPADTQHEQSQTSDAQQTNQ